MIHGNAVVVEFMCISPAVALNNTKQVGTIKPAIAPENREPKDEILEEVLGLVIRSREAPRSFPETILELEPGTCAMAPKTFESVANISPLGSNPEAIGYD